MSNEVHYAQLGQDLHEAVERLKVLESVVMSLMKDKTTKDLAKIFGLSEKEVRDIKAIISDRS
jgi:hypothetical protein